MTILREKSLEFSIEIVKLCDRLPSKTKYWIISKQLIRSATSIGANIFEAISAHSRKDFIKFYEIGLKSSNETVYWLMLLERINDRNAKEILVLKEKAYELIKILCSSIKTMKSNKFHR